MPASTYPALPLSLFPSTGWWATALQYEEGLSLFTGILKEGLQDCNRYRIVTANGIQQLSVPIKGGRKQRAPISELQIDYTHDWQRQHWGALYSAYGRASYYEHYAPALEALIYKGFEHLVELNEAGIAWLSREMRLSISFRSEQATASDKPHATPRLPVYHQVFEDRWGFIPDLSAIDLLMNEGPYAAQYLRA